VARPFDVSRVSQQLGYPSDEDAPACVVDAVDVIHLDTDHRPLSGGIEFGTLVSGKHDVPVEHTKIHREGDRDAMHTEYHPADPGAIQELQTFVPVQLDQ
jgi:hypothetical protein